MLPLPSRQSTSPPAIAGPAVTELGVITVLGVISGDQVGFVLPHEHLTVDNRVHLISDSPLGPDIALTLSSLAQARLAPRSIAENVVMDDDAATIAALRRYREAGGTRLWS